MANGNFTHNRASFADQEEFVTRGRRCATPEPTEFQKERVRGHLSSFRSANPTFTRVGPVEIPVRFHVVHAGGPGNVPEGDLDSQIDALNAAYKPHQFRFTKAGVTRTQNAAWSRMAPDSLAEREAKKALGVEPERTLNLYFADLQGGLLGWARFPWELAGDPELDGVVCTFTSLPGGEAPFDQGKTAVHEVGHWLGLYHTFQGGCTPPGDEVDDTPYEASAFTGTPVPGAPARDTCPQPGVDPITNFMDYSDDPVMVEFTAGQDARMHAHVALYRPGLLTPAARAGLAPVQIDP